MKLEIVELHVTQTSKILAFLSAIICSLIALIGLLALAAGVETDVAFDFIISITVSGNANKALLLLFMPILTFAATYISVAVLCIVYNIVAKYTGGITFQTKPQ